MVEEIVKHRFKQNTKLQIEVVPLESLIIVSKKHLTTPHRTNFYHIFLLENCQPTHIVDFEQIKLQSYSLFFIDKDRVHQFDQLLNYEGRIIIFTDDFFTDTKFLRNSILFNDFAEKPTITPGPKLFQRFVTICENIAEELTLPNDHFQQIVLKNYLHNFLILAEREKHGQGYREIEKGADLDYTLLFRDLLETNFTRLKSVSDYASQIFISEKRLGQATTKILGKLPKEIIKERVLLEAKRLLVHSNHSIKEIGQELGFEDPAYFVRYFKKGTDTTPVKFREKHLAQ